MVVVGTPGRIAELSRSGQLQMHQTGILVLDEVIFRTPRSLLMVTAASCHISNDMRRPSITALQPGVADYLQDDLRFYCPQRCNM